MQNLSTPCLRADVAIRPFDAAEGDCRFLVAVDDRHFVVTAAVAAVLEESRCPTTLALLAHRASARLGVAVSPAQAGKLLNEQAPKVLFRSGGVCAPLHGPMQHRKLLATAASLKPLLASAAKLFTVRAAVVLAALLVLMNLLAATSPQANAVQSMTGLHTAIAAALTLVGIVIHELGHLAACAKYGATHGGIGLGIYWCVPAFYAEVHGAWLLPRRARAVVDVGGIYFQCAYVIVLGAMYLASGAPFLLSAIVWTHLLMLHTLNPVLKYDGYWLLSDLTGTPNLHRRVQAITRQVLRAVCDRRLACLPQARDLALLGAFTGAATAYFAYVIVLLGRNIGLVASEVTAAWTTSANTLSGVLRATGDSALLALLAVMALGVSTLLARSLGAIIHGSAHDR